MPFVGPREHKRAGASGRKSRPNLPIQRAGLDVFRIPKAVESDLRHQKRALPRDVLQTGEVGFQLRLRFEVNVETNQIDEG